MGTSVAFVAHKTMDVAPENDSPLTFRLPCEFKKCWASRPDPVTERKDPGRCLSTAKSPSLESKDHSFHNPTDTSQRPYSLFRRSFLSSFSLSFRFLIVAFSYLCQGKSCRKLVLVVLSSSSSSLASP